MSSPSGTFMVNYTPINHAGYEMWFAANYNGQQYQDDLATAKGLGFNTVRCFIASTYNAFDFSSPTTAELNNLKDFYQRAKNANIKLRLCLFDWWSAYGKIGGCTTWLQAVLSALPDFTYIHSIEIQNETSYASASSYTQGFDAGWSGSQPSTIGATAQGWAKQIVPLVRSAAPGVPITTSCTNGTADILAGYSALNGGSAAPDWYEWHCYGWSGQIQHELEIIQQNIGSAQLMVGETGIDSSTASELGQVRYIDEIRRACINLGLPEPAPWILFDLKVSAQFPSGQTFGLIDVNGNLKQAGIYYQNQPPGSTFPTLSTKVLNY